MFLSNSRYAAIETIVVRARDGREVTAVKLRRLGDPGASDYTVVRTDRLDIIARRQYGDATLFWHVADANTELEAGALVDHPGRVVETPDA